LADSSISLVAVAEMARRHFVSDVSVSTVLVCVCVPHLFLTYLCCPQHRSHRTTAILLLSPNWRTSWETAPLPWMRSTETVRTIAVKPYPTCPWWKRRPFELARTTREFVP
jgi:hypothetical protein